MGQDSAAGGMLQTPNAARHIPNPITIITSLSLSMPHLKHDWVVSHVAMCVRARYLSKHLAQAVTKPPPRAATHPYLSASPRGPFSQRTRLLPLLPSLTHKTVLMTVMRDWEGP